MELVKGIKERRSTRKFTDQAVSEDDIREIVATAAYAPSWKNTQTSRYIAVVNPEKSRRSPIPVSWDSPAISGLLERRRY